jgi:effector-binding domain-containing protein
MMDIKCEKVQKAERHALVVRTVTSIQNLPQMIGSSYHKIMALMGEYGEQPADMPFVAYYNMDMQKLEVEIGFPTAKPLPGREDVQAVVYPAVEVATCMHAGPYDAMVPTYEALTAWIAAQGREPSGVVFEYYLNDPAEVGEEKLLTRIEMLLKDK